MAYDELRYNRVRFKASHNSYDRDETLSTQLDWNPSQPWQGGCRGVEFDIWRHSDDSNGASRGYFTVAHSLLGNVFDSRPLADYLDRLRDWHDRHPGHDPVTVHIDIKSSHGSKEAFPAEIDRYLRTWFGEASIVKPGSLLNQPSDTLLAAVERKGWPTIRQLRGKFLFCLTGNEDWKGYYAHAAGATSLCFADFDIDDMKTISQVASLLRTDRVFIGINVFTAHFDNWRVLIPALIARGYFVRGYVLDSDQLWSKGLQGQINALATDEITGGGWAHVGSEPFQAI